MAQWAHSYIGLGLLIVTQLASVAQKRTSGPLAASYRRVRTRPTHGISSEAASCAGDRPLLVWGLRRCLRSEWFGDRPIAGWRKLRLSVTPTPKQTQHAWTSCIVNTRSLLTSRVWLFLILLQVVTIILRHVILMIGARVTNELTACRCP